MRRFSGLPEVKIFRHCQEGVPATASREYGGKGAGRENVFVERLSGSANNKGMYLRAYESRGGDGLQSAVISAFYNRRRPHSVLDGGTSEHAYFNLRHLRPAT